MTLLMCFCQEEAALGMLIPTHTNLKQEEMMMTHSQTKTYRLSKLCSLKKKFRGQLS